MNLKFQEEKKNGLTASFFMLQFFDSFEIYNGTATLSLILCFCFKSIHWKNC